MFGKELPVETVCVILLRLSAGSRITWTVSAGSHFLWMVVLAGSKRLRTVSAEADNANNALNNWALFHKYSQLLIS